MRTNATRMWLFLAALFLVAAASGPQLACKGSDGGTGADGTDLAALVGTWAGTWEDTRYRVDGAVSMTITATEGGFEATGSIDLKKLGLGEKTGRASGTVDGGRLSYSFISTGVGSGSGTLEGRDGSGSGTVTAPLNFGAFTFSGSVSGDTMTGAFDFSSPSGGRGNATLARQ